MSTARDEYADYSQKNRKKFLRRFSTDLLNNRYFRYYGIRRIEHILKEPIPKGGYILDVGCGTGLYSELINEIRPDIRIMNADLSEDFIAMNRQKLKVVADSANMPFKDSSFDLAFCIDVLHHVHDIESSLAEMKRVSKDRVVLIEPNLYSPINFPWYLINKEERGLLRMSIPKLKSTLRTLGFKIESAQYFEFIPFYLPGLNRATFALQKMFEKATEVPLAKHLSAYVAITASKRYL